LQTNNTLTKTKKDCKGLFVKNEIFITFVKILNIIKMKKLFMIAALGAAACGMNAADPYKVQVPGTADLEGAMLYIINYDNGEYVDSVLCEGEMTVFEGTIDEPIPARLIMDGKRGPSFILENGSISFDKQGKAFGSPLNDVNRELNDSLAAIGRKYNSCTSEAEKEAVYAQYEKYLKEKMDENIDNPVGLMIFMQTAYGMAPEELEAYVAKVPSLQKSQRVSQLIEMNRRKAATGVGAKYTDFDINGKKLSDYVGKDGKYLLVDFWASWCGPCRREIPGIKELLAANSDKLNVLGVAVWDKVADTKKAIKDLDITWPVILDAQQIPTDIYGISGIPCIMLIAPDGTIVSRDKQGADLKADVEKALK